MMTALSVLSWMLVGIVGFTSLISIIFIGFIIWWINNFTKKSKGLK